MHAARQVPTRSPRRGADERRDLVLDTATRLFTAHGVHAVGMDRVIAETGLSKMSVYRVFPTKDELVGAYLARLAGRILDLLDRDVQESPTPAAALHRILGSIEQDLRRPDFRGCPFGNAAGEFDDDDHPARRAARDYRASLLARLDATARRVDSQEGPRLARRLAVLIDGGYLSAAHLGPDGPSAEALAMAHDLVDAAANK